MKRSYDMTYRNAKKSMHDLQRTLAVVKKKPRRVGRERRIRRREAREARLPKDRKCPKCPKIVVESRSWVIKGDIVVCRSCWFKYYL